MGAEMVYAKEISTYLHKVGMNLPQTTTYLGCIHCYCRQPLDILLPSVLKPQAILMRRQVTTCMQTYRLIHKGFVYN